MKITMARRDDVLRRQQEYNDKRSKYDSEVQNFREAEYTVMQNLENLIRSKIGDTVLDLSISAARSGFNQDIEVSINNGSNPHDSQALNWNYDIKLKRSGDVQMESGSWSGLSATTDEQIQNLKESVRVIEILNNLDWKTLLNVELPDYNDYVTSEYPKNENFNQQLLEADVLDAMDDGLLIKGHGYKYYNPRAVVFYHILKENPKSFTVQEIHEDDLSDESRWPDPYTIQKYKLYSIIDNPIKTAEV